jgi:hypothetical protein
MADAIAQAQHAISALKQVPGPEVCHLGPPLIDARAKGYDWGELVPSIRREMAVLSVDNGIRTPWTSHIGLYSVFSSADELQKYAVSEAHVKTVTDNVRPYVDGESIYIRRLPS